MKNRVQARSGFLHTRRGKRLAFLLLAFALVILLVTVASPYVLGTGTDSGTDSNSAAQNAYINNSPTPQNGTPDNHQIVQPGDTIKYQLSFTSDRSGTSAPQNKVPAPTFQSQADRPVPVNFKNGSFEEPVNAGSVNSYLASAVPGWQTTAPDKKIEIQKAITSGPHSDDFAPFTMDGGEQYAELNANYVSTLYQSCDTVPGTKLYWEFYHGARMVLPVPQVNTDVMRFYLQAPGTESKPSNGSAAVQNCSDSAVRGQDYQWGHYTGEYVVPANQNKTAFVFESVSTTSSTTLQTMGNYLDGVRLYTSSYLDLALSNNAPLGLAAAGDVVTYSLQVTNTGESDARGVQVTQVLPAGTALVAGSVQVDSADSQNYLYDPATRVLSVNIGAGATSADGGLVRGSGSFSTDCQNTYAVVFQASVTGDQIAANDLYESQAAAEYQDRYQGTEETLANYSNVSVFAPYISYIPATVTDVVPDGLTVTGYQAPAGSTFTQDGQGCTWSFSDLAAGEHLVSVTATVDQAGAPADFVNRAVIEVDGLQSVTNSTYHTTQVPVTERFVALTDPKSTLLANNTVMLTAGQGYAPAPGTPPASLLSGGKAYKYWGYRVDCGQIFTGTPDPAHLPSAVDGPHTIAYLYVDGTESGAQKYAFVNDGPVQNGTADDPVPVKIGDDLTYQISVNNPGLPDAVAHAHYDVLFVVDWSGSMLEGKMFHAGMDDIYAITYARNLSHDMSQYILDNYPGSRVGLLGLSSLGIFQSNQNDIGSVYIASDINHSDSVGVDTPFVGTMGEFDTQIAPLFKVPAQYSNDDVAVFLRAGIDKMMGLDTLLGSDSSFNPRHLIPRDDQSRVPVIVLISDFQIDKSSYLGYWTTDLKAQSDRFAAAYPDGILMTVRLDTDENSKSPSGDTYSSPSYDKLMSDNVAPANHGEKGWAFSKVTFNTSYSIALRVFKNSFTLNAPPPPPVIEPSTVTDVVPSGLTIVSTDPVAAVDGQTVTWDLNQLPAGETVLTVQTQVAEHGSFENTAQVATHNEDPYDTNTTYHRSIKAQLGFVKVNEQNSPLSGAQFSLYSRAPGLLAEQLDDWLASDDPSSTWTDPVTATSASDGSVSFTDLMPGNYMLVETQTRPGYELPQGQWLVTVAGDASISITAHGYSETALPPAFQEAAADSPYANSLLLPNYRQMAMPVAGAPGAVYMTVFGTAVIGAGVAFLVASAPSGAASGRLAMARPGQPAASSQRGRPAAPSNRRGRPAAPRR